jgi:Tol biopolymer transport system component
MLTTMLVLAACSGAPPATQGPAASAALTPSVTATTTASAPTAAPTSDVIVRDGESWIAFQWLAGSGDGIFLIRADGTGKHRIGAEAGKEQIHPDWSPDGMKLAFTAVTSDGDRLWQINADGTKARELFACNLPCNYIEFADWAPDGSAIYFGMGSGGVGDGPPTAFQIGRFDLATGEAAIVVERKDGMTVEQPRISPDGKLLAYTRFKDVEDANAGSAIFVADANGEAERRLTEWNLFGAFPDWSLDGRIVFNSRDLGVFQETTEAANLYSMAADGSDLRQLTHYGRSDTRATQPRWTPDGFGITYTQVSGSGMGDRRLAYIASDGAGQRPLTPFPTNGTHPTLRPLAT